MGFVQRLPPSTLRMLVWPEASSAQNSVAAVSADGSTVCVLILRLNSSCSRSIAFVVRALRHWLGGRRVKVKRRSPASSRLSATARCLSRHLPMPRPCGALRSPRASPRRSCRCSRCRFPRAGARARAPVKIAMLMNGAPLCTGTPSQTAAIARFEPRRAIDDEELGSSQTASDGVCVEDAARQASVLSPPMLLIASSTFWPSSRTPSTTSSEIEVADRP